jgi:hypothetical protein
VLCARQPKRVYLGISSHGQKYLAAALAAIFSIFWGYLGRPAVGVPNELVVALITIKARNARRI